MPNSMPRGWDRAVSELGRHHEHPQHRAAYQGVVTGYHSWQCQCGQTLFTERGPQSVPPPWTGRTSSATRRIERTFNGKA